MGVPKRKRSRARRDSRHANKGLHVKAIAACHNCQTPLATHAACTHCGFYKGVKVMKTKVDRALKRGKTKQAQAARVKTRGEEQSSEKE